MTSNLLRSLIALFGIEIKKKRFYMLAMIGFGGMIKNCLATEDVCSYLGIDAVI
jgi:hypothetical protein